MTEQTEEKEEIRVVWHCSLCGEETSTLEEMDDHQQAMHGLPFGA